MKKNEIRRLTLTALFVALVFLLGLTPVGLIPLGFINLTTLCIPVVIGTMMMGLKRGLLFGFFFGLVSTMSAFGVSMMAPSWIGTSLLGANVLYLLAACFVPRLLVPVTTFAVYKALTPRFPKISTAVAAAVGSLTNTVLYLGLVYVFFSIAGLDLGRLMGIILGAGMIGGACEAVAAAVIATPVLAALNHVKKA